ncbi:MAG TPA: mannitol-1-phosphate 5-dehydrogenase [Candidatus Hydrogenedentes bacterium]|nr:mannitol-1-phosphate 5-dehydrogenase [Candidatus Hydrogenedentota bacterium]HPG66623.1 mannitol-1-phosphate 5-dehydrogenase [Candidatus Hydrogenedentota bacterium]
MMMKKAVQFGAGNIGRGFLGQLYFESGYETTFVDVIEPVVEGLKQRGEYPLRIVGELTQTLRIGNVTAVYAQDTARVAQALAEADLASTAVGVSVLPKVAPAIAAGVAKRFEQPNAEPLNLIVCENLIGAGPFLREKVRDHLPERFHSFLDERVGFVETSIGRMVPVMTAEELAEDPLLVCVEPYCELPVDARGFRGPLPPLEHMEPRQNFAAYVERKLFVHNAGHATTAYLGYIRGHEYTWQAIEDPVIRREADAAIAETCAGLVAKHGLDPRALDDHWSDLKRRFANRGLGDQVFRVAKDPIRKLGPNDRLIGAGLMCLAHGVTPAHVAFAAAAAIRYDHPDDAAAVSLRNILSEHGIRGVIERVCGIAWDSPFARLIEAQTDRLHREGWLKH